MELIIRPRQGGKTTETLRLAAEHFAYIVVPTQADQERIWRLSLQLQLNIPYPITWAEFVAGARGRRIDAFVIDDVDRCIQQTAALVPVIGASATGNPAGEAG